MRNGGISEMMVVGKCFCRTITDIGIEHYLYE